jgi:hypothetical protein
VRREGRGVGFCSVSLLREEVTIFRLSFFDVLWFKLVSLRRESTPLPMLGIRPSQSSFVKPPIVSGWRSALKKAGGAIQNNVDRRREQPSLSRRLSISPNALVPPMRRFAGQPASG